MAAGKVDLGGCVTYGVDALKRNPAFHILSTLIIGIIGGCTAGILVGPMIAGYIRALRKEEGGGKAEIGELFSGFKEPVLVPSLVASVIVTVAMVLIGWLIIPIYILMPMLTISVVHVLNGETDGVNAIKRSWETMQSDLLMAAVTALVLGLVASLGMILCIVGVLVTAPINMAGMYKLACQLGAEDGGSADAAQLTAAVDESPEEEE